MILGCSRARDPAGFAPDETGVADMAGWSRISMLVAVLVLGGCAGRPHGILLPVAATVPGAGQVDMLVATTRAHDDNDPAEMFSGDRALTPSYAAITVSIPPDANRKVGEVQWPATVPGNPEKDFVTLRADIIDRTAALGQLHAELARTPHRQVLVFVHGYNNKFKDAVFRFAQIVHDSGTAATPVLFTWPSRARLLAYGYDRDSTTFSRDELERLLQMLAQDKSVGEVTILAHSMGNWLTLETLRQMAIRGKIPAKITTVMLADADVDMDVFRTQIRAIGTKGPKFTVFVSQDDGALALSRRLAGNSPRLGAIDPDKEPYRSEFAADGISVLDLTKVRSQGDMNHDKFAASPEVVRLIGARLASGQTISDEEVSLGDKIYSAAASASTSAATAASMPFDPDVRESFKQNFQTDAPQQ
jgi:esterase/lipase superfamily enzyme